MNQAVIVEGDCARSAQNPDDAHFEIGQLEDRLTETIALNEVGEFEDNEVGAGGATQFRFVMLGDCAKSLFSAIEKDLRASRLARGARVVMRYGPPGAPEEVVSL